MRQRAGTLERVIKYYQEAFVEEFVMDWKPIVISRVASVLPTTPFVKKLVRCC